MIAWIRRAGADVVALVEANDWGNRGMAQLAARCGYPFSYVFETQQPYHLAFMSYRPIRLVHQENQMFQRGMLHVDIGAHICRLPLAPSSPAADGVHYVLVHLHAHESSQREIEASRVREYVMDLSMMSGWPVILLGDMNSLSAQDSDCHGNLVTLMKSDNKYEALAKKFLAADRTAIAYSPMDKLLSVPLVDMVLATSRRSNPLPVMCASLPASNVVEGGQEDDSAPRAWLGFRDNATACGFARCLFSEPTDLKLDQAPNAHKLPGLRVDYVLASEQLLAALSDFSCGPVFETATQHLSDHFPVMCHFTPRAGQ
jgi:endonuclease/exonuclease/phosphatase family metal-dependent hydrolase